MEIELEVLDEGRETTDVVAACCAGGVTMARN